MIKTMRDSRFQQLGTIEAVNSRSLQDPATLLIGPPASAEAPDWPSCRLTLKSGTVAVGNWPVRVAAMIGSFELPAILDEVRRYGPDLQKTEYRNLLIEASQIAAAASDENFLAFAAEHVFGCGYSVRRRDKLAAYLFPIRTGNARVPTPLERLTKILDTTHPDLYVRAALLDRYGFRGSKEKLIFEYGGKCLYADDCLKFGGASYVPSDELNRLAAPESDLCPVEEFSPDQWLWVAEQLRARRENRTADELEAYLCGKSKEAMGEKNYRHFLRQAFGQGPSTLKWLMMKARKVEKKPARPSMHTIRWVSCSQKPREDPFANFSVMRFLAPEVIPD